MLDNGRERVICKNRNLEPFLESRIMNVNEWVQRNCRFARQETLDLARIQQFRSDFLTLMRNLGQIDNYDKAIFLSEAVTRWNNDFDDYIYKHLLNDFKNLRYRNEVSETDWAWWDSAIRKKTWDFVSDFRRLPIQESDDYWSKGMRFERYKQDLAKWKARVERNSRTAWGILGEFANWYAGKYGKSMAVNLPDTEQLEIEGFSVILKGYGKKSERIAEGMGLLREALKRYKEKARILPWLLKYRLPILIDFYAQLDEGGRCLRDMISINPYVFDNSPDKVVSVLAHEMGHHLWYIMGGEAQQYWSNMLKGGMIELDLRNAIKNYGDDEWVLDNEKMMRQEPYLYNQLMGLKHSHSIPMELKDASTIGDIRKYLDSGGNNAVLVYSKPISGYAHKSPDEAFCEAVSNLVAYGPRAVPEEAIEALRTVLLT